MLSSRSIGRLACVAAALASMQVAEPALAAPTDDEVRAARDLFVQAVQDEDAERWEDALDKLARVSKVKLTAGVSYHVALCNERLGHLATALASYQAAQDEATRTDAQDVLRLVGPQLASLTPRVPRLSLKVEPGVQDPSVTVDGEATTHLDIPLALDPGLHRIEASAPGRASSSVTVEVHEGDVTILRVTLSLLPPRAASGPASGAPESEAARPQATSPSPIAGIVAAAGAGVLAGLGVGAFVAGGSAHSDAVRECAEMTTSCESLKDTVRTWDWTALGAWGGAAASFTLAALLLTRHSADEPTPRAAHVVVGPGSLGVAGSF
jgi:hypothetical protein